MLKYSILVGSILLGSLFFLAGVLTLPNYGINWDTINHLPRGQSYLHFFLTGNRDFLDLPKFQWYWQDPTTLAFSPDRHVTRISLYQATGLDFSYFVKNDGGHPPLSDILSSTFNLIFFQKLGLINDIDSYRVYGVFLAASLVGLVFWWIAGSYGKVAGIISALSLATYPFFWSESHFNTEKDIPEAVYLSFLLFSIWKGFNLFSARWMLLSGILFGLALGTKFNVVFAPFILVPWAVYFTFRSGWYKNIGKTVLAHSKFFASIFIAPIIGLVIFFASWPYLWADPISRLQNVVGFYKGIGLTTTFNEQYLIFGGVNSYPIQAILYTTPIPVLSLFSLGLFYMFRNATKDKHGLLMLLALWFIVVVGRVTWPGTSIYGGLRQIMEYIPAMAMISGLGGLVLYSFLKQKIRNSLISFLIVLVMFVPHFIKLVQIHPNENAYFNSLIGGLTGARERNFPFWGNSFGGAYRQGVVWLNGNAPKDAKIAYARELIPNVPRIWLSPEASLSNGNRSGYLRTGEYVISLTYEGTADTSYFDRYLERYLEPIYQVKVDDVPILKIWKNDAEHTRTGYLNENELGNFNVVKTDEGIRIDVGEIKVLSRLESNFTSENCAKLSSSYVLISKDGQNWERLPGTMPGEDWSVPKFGNQPQASSVLIPFAADKARYVDLVIKPKDTCLKNIKSFKIYAFE